MSKKVEKHVIAMGGGGFSMEPDNPLLDLFVLDIAKKSRGTSQPNVCFLATASGDAEGYIDRFYKAFRKLPASPTHLSLFRGSTPDLASLLLKQDVIYVSGGNTRNLMVLWKEWGVDALMREAYEKGIILAGISAGSICWFEQGVTDSIPGSLNSLACLGILKGSNCPHYDGEAQRRPSYQRLMSEGKIGPGLACDDSAALHFQDGVFKEAVCSVPTAQAYRLEVQDDKVIETPVKARYLGGKSLLIRRAVPADALGIHEAHMRSIREVCSKDHSPEEIKAWGGREFREEQRLKIMREGAVWTVEDKGVIEGYAALLFHGDEAELAGMYITPKVIGKGIGKRLFELAQEESRNRKMKRLKFSSTITSLGFYELMGAKRMGDLIEEPINGQPVRCYPMSKDL